VNGSIFFDAADWMEFQVTLRTAYFHAGKIIGSDELLGTCALAKQLMCGR